MPTPASRRKPESWTIYEQQKWRDRLMGVIQPDDAVCAAWNWILPLWAIEPYRSYANKLIDNASNNPSIKKALERFDKPSVHLPALLWRIWVSVEFEKDHPKRGEKLQRRKEAFLEISRICKSLAETTKRQTNVINYLRNNREECSVLLQESEYEQPAEACVDDQIDSMTQVGRSLDECALLIDKSIKGFWPPLIPQPVTEKRLDTFSFYLTIHIAQLMLGCSQLQSMQILWKPITTLMNAVASIQGYKDPFNAEKLLADFKTLQKGHSDYAERWDNFIDKKRMRYVEEFNRYLNAKGVPMD